MAVAAAAAEGILCSSGVMENMLLYYDSVKRRIFNTSERGECEIKGY